ncbi:MAG: tyrosine-type recombinase/integrase [Spirochaetia bacterium]|nr:tyrosine-type recombinase/integrase [Spirochaetia bacterium]
MSRYSLFKRGKIYYAQIKNPDTGKYFSARSTGQTEESEALLIVSDWLRNGLPEKENLRQSIDIDTVFYALRMVDLQKNEIIKLIDLMVARKFIESAVIAEDGPDTETIESFLKRIWDYDTSPYVREKKAYGQSIGKRHCYEMTNRIKYFTDHFGTEIRLRDLTRSDLESFQFALKEKGLAARTINIIMNVITVPIRWAHLKGLIRNNPTEGLRRFSGKPKKRDILTPEEVEKVFSMPWHDERARVANLVAMTTGLRQGEIIALKLQDILEDRILVRHSWSYADGLKKPKNGEERTVPLLPSIRKEILKLASKSPWGKDGFIFYGLLQNQPYDGTQLTKGLKKVLINMRLPEGKTIDKNIRREIEEEWMERGVCFHSWRHYYAKHLADKIELRKVQLATGHKSGIMAEHYANHTGEKDFSELAGAVETAFSNILPFAKEA